MLSRSARIHTRPRCRGTEGSGLRGKLAVGRCHVRAHIQRMLTPLIDGLGHATWSLTMPVSRSRTPSFWQNRHFSYRALVALKLLVSLLCRFVACSARIVVDRQTDRQTHRPSTVTLAAHARRGLIITTHNNSEIGLKY